MWALSQSPEWDETLTSTTPHHLLLFPLGMALQACRCVLGVSFLLSSQSRGNLSSPSPYRKLHSGMKTYGCELCGKRFLDSLRLRMHLLAHSGRQGLLQRPHVGTDNHLLPFSSLTQSWPWSGCLHCQPEIWSSVSLGSSFQFHGAEEPSPECAHQRNLAVCSPLGFPGHHWDPCPVRSTS